MMFADLTLTVSSILDFLKQALLLSTSQQIYQLPNLLVRYGRFIY